MDLSVLYGCRQIIIQRSDIDKGFKINSFIRLIGRIQISAPEDGLLHDVKEEQAVVSSQ